MINRLITDSILADYKRKKVIVLLGARQVGKTTLLSALREGKEKVLSLNCDNMDDVLALEGRPNCNNVCRPTNLSSSTKPNE